MSKQTQTKKDQIIADLILTRRKITQAACSIPAGNRNDIFLGVWSLLDLLAHLVGWDFTNLEAAQSILAGELPGFYAHHDRGWKTYNKHLVEKYKRGGSADMISSVKKSHQDLISFLKTIPPEDFDRDTGVRSGRYKVTIDRLLQVEIEDEQEHFDHIDAFRVSLGEIST